MVLDEISQGLKMDVIIKENQAQELEDKLPIDRCVSVVNGKTNLYDTEFEITDDMIEEITNDK